MAEPRDTLHRERSGLLWPLGAYAVLSLLLFGVPVLGHLGSRIVGSNDFDPSAYMWFLGWWPHALLHGLNPFITHAMFYPDGYNLTWAASIPLPSLVLTPITLAFGPVVSWNVLQLLTPTLSAWTAFLLCRHIVGRPGPSLIGGYVFGFAPYVLSHLTGAPNLAFVALLPMFVLIAIRRLEGTTTPRRFVIEMALALAAQYLISAEVLATSTLFGGVSLLLAYALFAERRGALLDLAKHLIVAYAAMAILVSPFLYYFVFGHHYAPGLTTFSADLVAFVLPPTLVAITRHTPPFAGTNIETYLGLPLIAVIGLWTWLARRTRGAWLVVLSLLVAAICSLGSHLRVGGHLTSIPGPWFLLQHLPVLRYALPSRFAVFVALPAALIVAFWLSWEPIRGRARLAQLALAALAVTFAIPDVGSSAWSTSLKEPVFFSSNAYRAYLNGDDHVLTIPASGPSERWVASAGFPFVLTDGYAGQQSPAGYSRFPVWQMVNSGELTSDYAAQLRRFVAAKDVTAIVVDETVPGPWRTLFGSLGIRPISTGGVLLYRLGHRGATGT